MSRPAAGSPEAAPPPSRQRLLPRWHEGKCLVFDDHFEHEAWNQTAQDRVVLIVNLWHSDLSAAEIHLLEGLQRYAFANARDMNQNWSRNAQGREMLCLACRPSKVKCIMGRSRTTRHSSYGCELRTGRNSHGVEQWAIDPDAAQKLWTVSLNLISQSATLGANVL